MICKSEEKHLEGLIEGLAKTKWRRVSLQPEKTFLKVDVADCDEMTWREMLKERNYIGGR